tara:strand:- start:203 stop:820 length:618 start_codon:yes stop_codon:yes gene_type:complete
MISRKKKVILIQFFLLCSGLIIFLFTYINFEKINPNKIISKETKTEIDKKIEKGTDSKNIFYDIKYTGIDLSGNRYILKAKEAENDKLVEGLLNLKSVSTTFYFKDNKNLTIYSDFGMYNNKTLDMTFEKNVRGSYEESILLAEKGEYLNSKNLLIITEKVSIKDFRGTMLADKLIFDIKKNTLDISSSENKKINANLTLNEKDF